MPERLWEEGPAALQYIESPSTDPRWNLALEEYVFSRMDRSRSYFMLWQNHNTIVIGKNQNAAAEINAQYVQEHGIQVVRRLSGGGAVYHDLGNLNYTFITDTGAFDRINFSRFCQPVMDALRSLGVEAQLNGRNDMTIQGRKFSGNSQYTKGGRRLHHGTLLFRSNLDVLSSALRVSPDKIQSKGIPSVKSRVANISDFLPEPITMEQFKAVIAAKILRTPAPEPYRFSERELAEISSIQHNRYNQWDWTYGYAPRYQINRRRRIEGCGTVEVSMEIREGKICALQLLGDFFGVEDIQTLTAQLIGCSARAEDIQAVLNSLDLASFVKGLSPGMLVQLLTGERVGE